MNWVTAEPVPNEPFYREASVKALEEEIRLLRQELIMQGPVVNRSRVSYKPLTTAQREEIRSQVQKYLRGVIKEIDIVNVRQIQEVFRQFKVIVSQQEEEVECRLRSKYGLGHGDFAAESGSEAEPGSSSDSQSDGAEEDQEDTGSSAAGDQGSEWDSDEEALEGSPPGSPTPGGKKEAKKGDEQLVKERGGSPPPETAQDESSPLKPPTKDLDEEEEGRDHEEASISSSEDSQKPSPPPSKQEAFELFKKEAGREIHQIFRENKRILISRKKRSHSVAQRMNHNKQLMEGVTEALEAQKRKQRLEGEFTAEKGQVVIDEKEFSLILKLKELKEEHRAGFAELQDLKAEIQYCQQLVDKCRKRLISEFEIWYNESFLIPEHVREALEPGGNIRPGMIPVNRVMCLDEDEQDRFERMQETALPECPQSVSFYRARMKTDQKHTFNRTVAALRKMSRKPGVVRAAGKKKAVSFLPIA